MDTPKVLILGHSFVHRLHSFIKRNEQNYDLNLGITEPVRLGWRGIGGCTVIKLRQPENLAFLSTFQADIVFLRIGTNDLTRRHASPANVGSAIEDFVRLLHDEYGVKSIFVGQTIRRDAKGNFNFNVAVLARYLKVVLEPLPYATYWGFWQSCRPLISYDGVHLNREGQHRFYRSIRGAVLQGLKKLSPKV